MHISEEQSIIIIKHLENLYNENDKYYTEIEYKKKPTMIDYIIEYSHYLKVLKLNIPNEIN